MRLLILSLALAACAWSQPAWLGKEPLIIAGNWDSMPIFRNRVGGESVDFEQEYARQHTEEAVIKLKELGVTMGVIHFYKGFGLQAEAAHIADARKLAGLLHKHGLRVGVYVGSTIVYETFLAEKPEAAEWFAPDFLGRPVVYGDQTFRKRVYFMHPGYREYMKRVLRVALEDLRADLIHFDNTSLQARPPIFHHPLAVRDFRDYLVRKYTPAERTARFGHSETRFIQPPAVERSPAVINDPLFQEWSDFRCEQLAAYYGEMKRFIRGINPQAAVECNPHSGISGRNTVWEEGVDYPRLLAHMDVVWTEEGNPPGVNARGVLVSKIRTYKMAALLGNRIFTYNGGARGGKLQMAEAMAFNRQTLGQVGSVLAGYTFPAGQKPYIRFFRDRFDLYRDVRSRPDVAVLHSYASMAYNHDQPWQSAMLAEQALIQAKVPFEIIFDAQLANLSRYRALVLPDQECLDEQQMALIRKYVEGGGGLVATGQTSLYTPWRRRRANFGLRDLFGVDAPSYRENLYTSDREAGTGAPATPPRRNRVGKGRSAYLPAIQPALRKPSGRAMTSLYWKLPLNWRQLIEEIRWAAAGFSLDVKGPLELVAEPLEQDGRLLVHLLNYDAVRRPSMEKIEVSVRLPAGKTARAVRLYSPDAAVSATVPVTIAQGAAVFTVPRVRTYTVAAVDLR